jgi:hypothetical protein
VNEQVTVPASDAGSGDGEVDEQVTVPASGAGTIRLGDRKRDAGENVGVNTGRDAPRARM